MQLPEDAIQEFIELYRKETGKTLPIKEAREAASNLVELYVLLARPLPSERKKEAQDPSADKKE